MNVKLILTSFAEAKSPLWRPNKYSLFPPLGLATLVAYLDKNDEIDLQDQHVEKLNLDDDPDLVIIQVYIANSSIGNQIDNRCRSYGIKIDVTISGNDVRLCQFNTRNFELFKLPKIRIS